jgi:hypothetical protein
MERPIDPITLKLKGGEEREFLLSMGGIRRLKKKLNAATIKDLLDRDACDAGIPILYEALLDKQGLTEDQFADLLPADLPRIGKAITELLGVSLPEPKPNTDPTLPSPTVQ